MGATVVAIVTSPWGKQSGAHFNPGVTLTFYRLGKMDFSDAVFYVAAQLIGGISGVVIATYLLLGAPGDPAVRYAVTIPGRYGNAAAFVAEMTISFILIITVLFVSNRKDVARYTPRLCRRTDRDILDLRMAAVRDEHEPGTNTWFGVFCQLLARALDLFYRAPVRHASRRRDFSQGLRRGRSHLREAAPRE